MSTIEITSKEQFDALVKDTPFVALQAHATWCGPCKMMSPIYKKLSNELSITKQYTFAHFDIDEVMPLAAELGIRSIPAFHFFKDGEEQEVVKGADPKRLEEKARALGEAARAKAAAFSTDEDF